MAARSNKASTTDDRPWVKMVLPSRMKLQAAQAIRSRAASENSANLVPRSNTWDLHAVKSGVSKEARVTYFKNSCVPEVKAV